MRSGLCKQAGAHFSETQASETKCLKFAGRIIPHMGGELILRKQKVCNTRGSETPSSRIYAIHIYSLKSLHFNIS
jgi:hypothetical protein